MPDLAAELAEHEAELRNLLHARIIGIVTPITGGHEVRIVCNSEQHAERICEILGSIGEDALEAKRIPPDEVLR